MKAAIVILNYNGEKHLKTFLPSVVQFCPAWAEIVVADNASSDGSLHFLSENYPQLKVIVLDQNYGFAGGYNRALRQIDATYYALINNDLEVTEGWLAQLIETIESEISIAVVQPKIKSYTDRGHFEYAGASGGFIDIHGYAFCRGRLFNNCERDIGQHDDPREVFWATGACMVIQSKSYWEVDGFDEDLFAHMEEIDLCWRLKNRGSRAYCNPAAVVYHLGGGTLNAHHPRKTYLNFRNNLAVMIKNDYEYNFWSKFFKRLLLDGLAAVNLLFRKGPAHFLAVLRAHFHVYFNFGAHLRKRNLWKEQATTNNRTGLYRSNVVFDYFLKKKRVFGALQSAYFVRNNRKHE